jgi:phosphoserine aminotransferase
MGVHNFSAGPAILPAAVLEQVQAELRDFGGLGVSVMEISHRSPEYEALNSAAQAAFKRLLGVGDEYEVLFLQGGPTLQFSMLPMNLLAPGATADYIMTGAWADKAYEEAALIGNVHVAASTRDEGYRRMPRPDELSLSDDPVYVHMTSNETIQGTQWHAWPKVGDAPLICDMSSDILSRPFDARRFAMIYAGAQKNLGPSGVTVVLIRQDLLEQARRKTPQPPIMLRYSTHAKAKSLYNTPPTFGVYVLGLVLAWVEQQGGVTAMERRNAAKAQAVYGAIDRSGGFYRGHAERDSRSAMNVTFRLPTEALEQQFVTESAQQGMLGLAGHRSVGGIRASMYNALELESAQALASFMDEFLRQNG